MTPRIQIIRRASFDSVWVSSGTYKGVGTKAEFSIDGECFQSGAPNNRAEEVEINSALERLVDFVNAVVLSK